MKQLTRFFGAPLPWGRCPVCNSTHQVGETEFVEKEDPRGPIEHGRECGEFAANTTCRKCSRNVLVAGSWSWEPYEFIDEDGEHDTDFSMMYVVEFCRPAPKLIKIPGKASAPVKKALQEAFSGYWFSNEFAAISIRKALEYTCDAMGIGGSNLHWRLEKICSDDFLDGAFANLKNTAIAAKLLGNLGAHEIETINDREVQFLFEAAERFITRVFEGDSLNAFALEIQAKYDAKKKKKAAPKKEAKSVGKS